MKYLLIVLTVLSLFFPSTILADSFTIASDATYTNQAKEFSPSQTIWAKVTSQPQSVSKSQLILKDNESNTISTYPLVRSGNDYTTSISAPASEGYYSLQAQLEGPGKKYTAVKTIKVGKPTNSSVNIKVNSEVKGENTSDVNREVESEEQEEELTEQSSTEEEKDTENNESILTKFTKMIKGFFSLFAFVNGS